MHRNDFTSVSLFIGHLIFFIQTYVLWRRVMTCTVVALVCVCVCVCNGWEDHFSPIMRIVFGVVGAGWPWSQNIGLAMKKKTKRTRVSASQSRMDDVFLRQQLNCSPQKLEEVFFFFSWNSRILFDFECYCSISVLIFEQLTNNKNIAYTWAALSMWSSSSFGKLDLDSIFGIIPENIRRIAKLAASFVTEDKSAPTYLKVH